jgi:hypothetical protein
MFKKWHFGFGSLSACKIILLLKKFTNSKSDAIFINIFGILIPLLHGKTDKGKRVCLGTLLHFGGKPFGVTRN